MRDFRQHKTYDLLSYWGNALHKYLLPKRFFEASRLKCLDALSDEQRELVMRRVAYYCRLDDKAAKAAPSSNITSLRLRFKGKHRASRYVMDLRETLCRFPAACRFDYLFGDITDEASTPAFVKSRPIVEGSTNSVVMKLDRLRHFRFVDDTMPFQEKRDMLVFRSFVTQEHRKRFLAMYSGHPMCDVGKINREENEQHGEWVKPFMSIDQQLQHKFICCLEGNDVATSLKWVMSSNSLAVMPRPKYETWFMEGSLIPGVHYVEIKPDYSDLIEKMEYYIAHPDEAQRIIDEAHRYVEQFQNVRLERAVQIATAESYFIKTGQAAALGKTLF